MSFLALAAARRSIRRYHDTPLTPEQLATVLEAARAAPSAGNLQAYEVFVVTDRETRASIARASWDQMFLVEAPVVLVFCANPVRTAPRYGERGEGLYAVQDATIACTFAMLAATDLGLGSVWVGAFDENAVARIVGIPDEWRPVAMLPIGHAAGAARATERRALSEFVHETP